MIDRRCLADLPSAPGVYFFRRGKNILYIGKATSLRERVRSYFNQDLVAVRGPRLVKMLAEATNVTWRETESVLEALILESALIKRHQPPGNAREKDDKSFWFVVITDEDYPRVILTRGRSLGPDQARGVYKVGAVFGPFPRGGELQAALKIIRRIFPFRDKCQPNIGRPCFYATIGLCPGVCAGTMSRTAYRIQISRLKKFFEGRKRVVVADLERAMRRAAAREDFVQAAHFRDQISALRHIADVSMIKEELDARRSEERIEAFDISHSLGAGAVGAMVVLLGGEPWPNGFRRFRLRRAAAGGDTAALTEILERRLAHADWPQPDLIVVDGGRAQINVARRALATAGWTIPVVGVIKDERHQPKRLEGPRVALAREKEILLANRLVHDFAIRYHRRERRREL